MGKSLDAVPFSGIIRIRDMMYSVKDPFRLDQGDVSFDAPDTVKAAMHRAIDENRSHYLQTTGVPRLLELLAEKMRRQNGIPSTRPDDVMVTTGGIHGALHRLPGAARAGRRSHRARSGVAAVHGEHPRRARRAGAVPAARVDGLALRPRRAGVEDHAEDARVYINSPHNPTGGVLTRADVEAHCGARPASGTCG